MGCTPPAHRKIPLPTPTPPEKIGLECPICLAPITLASVCPLSCGHNVHKTCLIEYYKAQVQNRRFPITCIQQDCEKELSAEDVREFIPQNLVNKYYDYTLQEFVEKNKENTSWCPTAGCQAVFVIQTNYFEFYFCPSCRKSYCLLCRSQAHRGVSCQDSTELKQFLKATKRLRMKQCPNCKYWVEKTEGCDHMKCRCKYQFCYRCGCKYKCSCKTQ